MQSIQTLHHTVIKSHDSDYLLFIPSEEENKVLHSLDKTYIRVSEMSDEEREYLNGIILRNRPKKLIEVGVSAGSSSVIILNAIKNDPEAKLYSIDYSETYYRDTTKKSGFIVDSYPELQSKIKLYTGGLSLKFIEEIGRDIDFCFIDTAHCNPGEILDTLMVLPFLKDDAIIVFHDVNLHTNSGKFAECNPIIGITNNLLISAISGRKYLQGNFTRRSPIYSKNRFVHFPNIGGLKMSSETKKHTFEIFNLLTQKWAYIPSVEEEKSIINFFSKYYDDYLAKYTEKVFAYHRESYNHRGAFTKVLVKLAIKNMLGARLKNIIKKIIK